MGNLKNDDIVSFQQSLQNGLRIIAERHDVQIQEIHVQWGLVDGKQVPANMVFQTNEAEASQPH